MAFRKGVKSKKFLLASLVTDEGAPCAFCRRSVDDEVTYGKLYAIGDIRCHYFCALLSCCLVQKGKDTEGLFGFLYPDIVAEVERSKKHKCSYCGQGRASLGCSVVQCRKQFHLPCGRERGCVSLFYGNFKSFCQLHAPKQKPPPHIMEVAKLRMKRAKSSSKAPANLSDVKEFSSCQNGEESSGEAESVCVICYEAVPGFPTNNTFWPVCCARDAWFHRTCLQRMALTAGMHYLKCPLCNDKEQFHSALMQQGYYVPDRDAAWELEQNAFAEIYERPLRCGEPDCKCPMGRAHDAESGEWDIRACLLCGTAASHVSCHPGAHFVCGVCRPAAPEDLATLAQSIDRVIRTEQAQARQAKLGPIMPSRMSLRRTKGRTSHAPSTSRDDYAVNTHDTSMDTNLSRLELNLKSPRSTRAQAKETETQELANTLLSPMKVVRGALNDKLRAFKVTADCDAALQKARESLRRPLPLSVKTRTVNNIIEKIFVDILEEVRATKQWKSPKKSCDIAELNANKENTEIPLPSVHCTPEGTPKRCVECTPEKLPKIKNETENLAKEDVPWTETSKALIYKEDVVDNLDLNDHSSNRKLPKMPNESKNLPELPLVENKVGLEDGLRSDSNVSRTETLPKEDVSLAKNSQALNPCEDFVEKLDTDDHSKTQNESENLPQKDTEALKIRDDVHENLPSDSSNSSFQLPPEFIANNSDDSISLIGTPNKLTTVEIEKDSSLEISNHDETVNVDVIKMESANDFKIKIPLENLKGAVFKAKDTDDIDIESFKSYYLTEVDKRFKCNFNHNHKSEEKPSKLRTAIDFAFDVAKKGEKASKRKSSPKHGSAKKRKEDKNTVVLKYKENKDIKVVCSNKHDESIDLTVSPDRRRRKSKHKREAKKNIRLKIKFRKEQLRLKITSESKKRKKNTSESKRKEKKITLLSNNKEDVLKAPSMKQYILKYSDSTCPNEVLVKPDEDVTPLKRKYVKTEKSPDNLKQTSIQNFFMKVSN